MRHKSGVVMIAVATLGLGSASLTITMLLIAVIPLRKREPWALWTLCCPALLYGVPMLIVDATNVPRESLFTTLGPQAAGLAFFPAGLVLVSSAILRRGREVRP